MSITIVQKSDLSQQRPHARRALVLASGAISGGAFKIGGLLALNRFFQNFTVNDFDLYVGASAGALLAAPLSARLEPRWLVSAIRGSSERLTQFRPYDFYVPNWREMLDCCAGLAHDVATIGPKAAAAVLRMVPRRRREITRLVRAFANEPSVKAAEELVDVFSRTLRAENLGMRSSYLPSGLFDNRRIETYLRSNFDRNGVPNDFRKLKLRTGNSLYVTATDLNTAQTVAFGHDEDTSLTISEAVQASTAIPVFFKPARVGPPGKEQDYGDAGLRQTASISTAVRHGAELIICYNPFRPYVNYRFRPGTEGRRSIGDMGAGVLINQAFRTLLHSRLKLSIELLRLDDAFRGDLVLIEPAETDEHFFSINPLDFWKRAQAAEHGYQSVKNSLEKHYETLRRILGAYGIEVDLAGMEDELGAIQDGSTVAEKFDVLEEHGTRPMRAASSRLKLVTAAL